MRGGAEPPSKEELKKSIAEHQDVLDEALAIYKERNARYGDAWRRSGWRGTLTDLRRKIERAWSFLWHADPEQVDGPDDIDVDDLMDIINYAVFSIRAIREGNRDGHGGWW